jgi:hypothetical protein
VAKCRNLQQFEVSKLLDSRERFFENAAGGRRARRPSIDRLAMVIFWTLPCLFYSTSILRSASTQNSSIRSMVHSRTFDDVIYELYISIFDVFDVCVPQDDKKQAFFLAGIGTPDRLRRRVPSVG